MIDIKTKKKNGYREKFIIKQIHQNTGRQINKQTEKQIIKYRIHPQG